QGAVSGQEFRMKLLFLGMFVLSLVALFPIRVAIDVIGLEDRGLTAREAMGSIWAGTLSDATFGPIPLGDVSAHLRFLPLLLGRAQLDFHSARGTAELDGTAVTSHGSFGAEHLMGHLNIH